jgi:peptide-methionine (R)-S-oxide reductase
MERRSLDTIAAGGVLVTLAIIGRGLAVSKRGCCQGVDAEMMGSGCLGSGFGSGFRVPGFRGSEVPAMTTKQKSFAVQKSEEEWRRILTPEQYHVLREHGTERPGSCALLHEKRSGVFTCAGCGQPLFVADRKFESGTGWPSFFAPLDGAIGTTTDRSFFMTRTEVHCSRCGGHLGHVFPDGPPPTGQRYCINGVALTFRPSE